MIDTLLDGISTPDEPEVMSETANDSTYESDSSTLGTSIGTTDSVSQDEFMQQGQMVLSSHSLLDMTAVPTHEQAIQSSSLDNSVAGEIFPNVQEYNLQYNNLEAASAASAIEPTVDAIALNQSSIVSSASGLDVDNLVNTPRTDNLDVSNDDVEDLQNKAEGIERSEHRGEISFGRKMCPTRHGCQGATDCDYSYGGYPG